MRFKKFYRENLPDEWMTKLDSFQRIIVLKCLRPDKVTNAMQDFVSENIGQRFIEPQVSFDYVNLMIIYMLCFYYDN